MSADLFDSRWILAHIRDTARARMVSPEATLGVVLAQVVAATPPEVQLPPIVGAAASLNLFVGIVAPPGGGKGASEATARAAVQVVNNNGTAPRVQHVSVGSGEGLARTFRPRGTGDDEPNPEKAAVFSVAEVDTLGALGGRTGSTLMSQLRSVYSGERLGFANAGAETRVMVEPHSYRACLIVGAQPARSGHLLDDADGGTPQRFLWFSASDPDAPDVAPPCPEPVTVTLPAWGPGATHLRVCEAARAEIVAHRRAVLRGTGDVDPLDGHLNLTRLKLAAALMLLDGRAIVAEDDWSLSGRLMAVSRTVRESCRRELRAKAKAANVARVHAAEEQEQERDRLQYQRALEYIPRRIQKLGGVCTQRDLSQGTKAVIRQHLETAIDELVRDGVIVAEAIHGGTRFTMAPWSSGPTVQHTNPQVEELDQNVLDTVGHANPQVNDVGPVGRVGPQASGESARSTVLAQLNPRTGLTAQGIANLAPRVPCDTVNQILAAAEADGEIIHHGERYTLARKAA